LQYKSHNNYVGHRELIQRLREDRFAALAQHHEQLVVSPCRDVQLCLSGCVYPLPGILTLFPTALCLPTLALSIFTSILCDV
jgi:hypothetical protein